MKINELATVTIPESTQLLITPFDKSVNSSIAKAITDSNLGVNPVDDGAGIRLNFPPLTEESRKEKAKIVNKLLEESKVEVRKERQDILKKIKHQKDEGEIGEDEMKRLEDELQKETEKTNKDLEALAKKKEDELMKF
jgi:ribosome recycling factor